MTTFSLLNFGCRASQADGAALKRQLLESGLTEAGQDAASDIAILNTCTVTAAADAEVRQTIRRTHRQNPACKILVTGCYAQRAPEELAALDGVAWVVGNSHKHVIPSLLWPAGAPVSLRGRAADSGAEVWTGEPSAQFHFLPVFPDDRTRPTLKVQDGCNARCSFCIIPSVRGRSRSLPPEEAVTQVHALEAAGYQEVVLSGINLGGYGRDLSRSITFLGLLEKLLEETGIRRLRISSIEPMDVTPELLRLAASEKRVADHFHVPLQSGCDRILRRMNRRYWAAQYAERVLAVRESMPHCGIGADVMTGFPGESDSEHAESARFIESMPFTYLHVFPFSARPGTAAASRPDQLNGRIAHERGRELRAAIDRKRHAFLSSQLGRTVSALTLSDGGEDGISAMSSNYLALCLPGSQCGSNRMLDACVTRLSQGRLYGYEVFSPEPSSRRPARGGRAQDLATVRASGSSSLDPADGVHGAACDWT
ncbi:MAG: tRNA (N(6)-L-threonylcarbamoyladenosine(37)-C(2))-methylthiotransferase MtaB [Terriglobia bacterium]